MTVANTGLNAPTNWNWIQFTNCLFWNKIQLRTSLGVDELYKYRSTNNLLQQVELGTVTDFSQLANSRSALQNLPCSLCLSLINRLACQSSHFIVYNFSIFFSMRKFLKDRLCVIAILQ